MLIASRCIMILLWLLGECWFFFQIQLPLLCPQFLQFVETTASTQYWKIPAFAEHANYIIVAPRFSSYNPKDQKKTYRILQWNLKDNIQTTKKTPPATREIMAYLWLLLPCYAMGVSRLCGFLLRFTSGRSSDSSGFWFLTKVWCWNTSNQPMVNWWFGARWFGIFFGVPLKKNPFHKGIPNIQTTGPQTTN